MDRPHWLYNHMYKYTPEGLAAPPVSVVCVGGGFFFPPVFAGDLLVMNSLMRSLTCCFSASSNSGNPSKSAGVSTFLVVALALCVSVYTQVVKHMCLLGQ